MWTIFIKVKLILNQALKIHDSLECNASHTGNLWGKQECKMDLDSIKDKKNSIGIKSRKQKRNMN